MSRPKGALDGLRVLDISSFLAAPQVATFLGDFGADVIKIEPPSGEALRRIGASRNGESLVWAMVSRNKRVITCDLNRPEGRDILRQLVAEVNVLVHNYSPAMLERWDCTWEQLRTLNPGLVMVSVSPYGHTGPLADRPGAGTMAEAFAGLTHMTGEADGPPMLTSIPLGDTLTGIFGLIGALVACYGRDVNGLGGQHVDVSMYEPILTLMGSTLAAWDPDGEDPPPMRFGSRLETGVPRNIYRTADNRYLCLSGTTDRQVERILALTGRDGPEDQAKFARMADRLAHNDELDALVADWIAQRSLEEAVAIFVDARIPVAPVHDLPGLLADAQVQARNSVTLVDHDVLGSVPMATPAPILSETPGAIDHPGPPIGAHNAEVYAELLGWDHDRLAQAQSDGLVLTLDDTAVQVLQANPPVVSPKAPTSIDQAAANRCHNAHSPTHGFARNPGPRSQVCRWPTSTGHRQVGIQPRPLLSRPRRRRRPNPASPLAICGYAHPFGYAHAPPRQPKQLQPTAHTSQPTGPNGRWSIPLLLPARNPYRPLRTRKSLL